jgi:hypothetical protein
LNQLYKNYNTSGSENLYFTLKHKHFLLNI